MTNIPTGAGSPIIVAKLDLLGNIILEHVPFTITILLFLSHFEMT